MDVRDRHAPVRNGMSVDVEDYFQVSAMEHAVDRRAWDSYPARVEGNVDRILELFAAHQVRATFFTLGWIAERYPALVRRIAAAGHEIASHGYEHVRVITQDRSAFARDVARTKARLEDVTGAPVRGYRAASFSIGPSTPWAFDVLAETGHTYSSTTYPIRHDLYGDPAGRRQPYRPCGDGAFLEIPVATVRAFGRNWPCGGGGSFRLFPLAYGAAAIATLNKRAGVPAAFYFHPWEIDPAQPRVPDLPLKARVRHYTNLSRMEAKLQTILERFHWTRYDAAFPVREA